MTKYLDEAMWWGALAKPDWYGLLADDFRRLEQLAADRKDEPDHKCVKGEAYELVERAVREGHIPIASSGDDFDAERKAIDTIVIHHTKNRPGMTLERLNAIQLLRIYGRYFADPTDDREKYLRGKAVWSGHFYEGRQVFWGYHWLVREDGTSEHILKDEYIGWHAGNWDVNTRSIGICIDDNLSEKQPGDLVLAAIADIIRGYYLGMKAENVVGHGDVNKRTACPGDLFHSVWRQKLLDRAF